MAYAQRVTPLDEKLCYRALESRDARFDGRLFVGVTSTGVYCRPVCPARTPKPANCRFFAAAAAAEAAGFRPCLRCRPETAPERGAWQGTSNTVSRGLELIAVGGLDGEGASVERLAERLGVGARHLRRLFETHLGVTPIAVAQTRRVAFAKQLIVETRLPMSEVALASGFGSVRRFNEIFRELFDRPPSALRRKAVVTLPEGTVGTDGVTLRVRYRAPYDFAGLLSFFRARAIVGVELVSADRYLRTFEEDGEVGNVEVAQHPGEQSLLVRVRTGRVSVLSRIVGRVRRMFDTASDVTSIGEHLAQDPLLAPLIARRPGLRVPGGWSGFETGVRAVLGQQVSVAAARQLAERLVRSSGTPILLGASSTRLFPSAQQVAGADLSKLGMPKARQNALQALAQAAIADPRLFEATSTIEETVARLAAVRGIGAWTAHYIALRAARDPDAFPSSDRGILRGMALCLGAPCEAEALERRAACWRPFRAHAAQHLWAEDAGVQPMLELDETIPVSKEVTRGKFK